MILLARKVRNNAVLKMSSEKQSSLPRVITFPVRERLTAVTKAMEAMVVEPNLGSNLLEQSGGRSVERTMGDWWTEMTFPLAVTEIAKIMALAFHPELNHRSNTGKHIPATRDLSVYHHHHHHYHYHYHEYTLISAVAFR